jgi:hypothetical protein
MERVGILGGISSRGWRSFATHAKYKIHSVVFVVGGEGEREGGEKGKGREG